LRRQAVFDAVHVLADNSHLCLNLYTGKVCGSRGGTVTIVHRRRQAEAVSDFCYADVGISQQRPGGLDVVVGEFRRTATSAAGARRAGSDEASDRLRGSSARWLLPLELAGPRQAT
jgi:hypothetical protein